MSKQKIFFVVGSVGSKTLSLHFWAHSSDIWCHWRPQPGTCILEWKCVFYVSFSHTSGVPCCLLSSDSHSDITVGSDCFTLGSSNTNKPRSSGFPSGLGTWRKRHNIVFKMGKQQVKKWCNGVKFHITIIVTKVIRVIIAITLLLKCV